MPKEFENFGDFQFDVLKEVGNIGAGHAATALSQIVRKTIDMKVPRVSVVPFDEIADALGGPEEVVAAIYLRILGDVPGNIFFILNLSSAKNLVGEFMGMDSGVEEFSDLELSALNEVGNILAGSYLSSLADLTKLNMQPSVPSIAIDMAGAVLSYGLLELSRVGDYALTIDTAFIEGEEEVKGYFFLLPEPDSFGKLFHALGVPFYE